MIDGQNIDLNTCASCLLNLSVGDAIGIKDRTLIAQKSEFFPDTRLSCNFNKTLKYSHFLTQRKKIAIEKLNQLRKTELFLEKENSDLSWEIKINLSVARKTNQRFYCLLDNAASIQEDILLVTRRLTSEIIELSGIGNVPFINSKTSQLTNYNPLFSTIIEDYQNSSNSSIVVGSVNGMRVSLTSIPELQINWLEINRTWSSVALLLVTLRQRLPNREASNATLIPYGGKLLREYCPCISFTLQPILPLAIENSENNLAAIRIVPLPDRPLFLINDSNKQVVDILSLEGGISNTLFGREKFLRAYLALIYAVAITALEFGELKISSAMNKNNSEEELYSLFHSMGLLRNISLIALSGLVVGFESGYITRQSKETLKPFPVFCSVPDQFFNWAAACIKSCQIGICENHVTPLALSILSDATLITNEFLRDLLYLLQKLSALHETENR